MFLASSLRNNRHQRQETGKITAASNSKGTQLPGFQHCPDWIWPVLTFSSSAACSMVKKRRFCGHQLILFTELQGAAAFRNSILSYLREMNNLTTSQPQVSQSTQSSHKGYSKDTNDCRGDACLRATRAALRLASTPFPVTACLLGYLCAGCAAKHPTSVQPCHRFSGAVASRHRIVGGSLSLPAAAASVPSGCLTDGGLVPARNDGQDLMKSR